MNPSPDDAFDVNQPLPASGVLLGIDYGTRRIGISVSDMYQQFSSPLHNYQRQNAQADQRFFRRLVEEYRPVGLVVGLPIHLSGDESEKSREARSFAGWLSDVLSLPVALQDERFSTAQAAHFLADAELTRRQRKERLDKLAAQVLLQAYLDSRRRPSAAAGESEHT